MKQARLSDVLDYNELSKARALLDMSYDSYYLENLHWKALNAIGLIIAPTNQYGCMTTNGPLASIAIEELTKRAIEKNLSIF